jgi:hypothetical protein
MDEAQLRAWDRELTEWRRKLAGRPVPPALEEELHAATTELETVRTQIHEPISGERVKRHLMRLADLWQTVAGDYEGADRRTTPA